jgi:hypothetical protein
MGKGVTDMKLRLLACVVFVLAALSLSPRSFHAQSPSSASDPYLTAHEWGTFTSIAGKDGHAIEWLPLTGSTDLPSFVEHFSGVAFKGGLLGTVRMETPVLYFYTNRETTVSVHVSFSKGLITEWYPRASRVYPVAAVAPKYASFPVSDWALHQQHPDGSITWDSVELQPRNSAEFPNENRANHYYAARQTSSTPLQIKTANGTQTEKFLFYRGVSTFAVPISVTMRSDGSVLAENLTNTAISTMLLFERRGDKLGFRMAQGSAGSPALDPPELNGDMNSLKRAAVDLLTAQGLYQDEAQAMFETWRDSWFEEGSRLLYVVPRAFVDSVLPLSISPAPAQTVRVFVGRLELVTPATTKAVEEALAAHDRSTLNRYGRFLVPIIENMIANEKSPAKQKQLSEYLNNTYNSQVTQNTSN